MLHDHRSLSEKLNSNSEDKNPAMSEVMGNKNSTPPRGPNSGTAPEDEGVSVKAETGEMLFSTLNLSRLFLIFVISFLSNSEDNMSKNSFWQVVHTNTEYKV